MWRQLPNASPHNTLIIVSLYYKQIYAGFVKRRIPKTPKKAQVGTLKSVAHFASRLYLVNFLQGPE
jgi:hypothetical protein